MRNKVLEAVGTERGAVARVAKAMNVPRQYISYYIKQGYVSREKAKDFCAATGAKLEDVLG